MGVLTWTESADTISPLRDSAKVRLSSVFPTPVAPVRMMTLGLSASVVKEPSADDAAGILPHSGAPGLCTGKGAEKQAALIPLRASMNKRALL